MISLKSMQAYHIMVKTFHIKRIPQYPNYLIEMCRLFTWSMEEKINYIKQPIVTEMIC